MHSFTHCHFMRNKVIMLMEIFFSMRISSTEWWWRNYEAGIIQSKGTQTFWFHISQYYRCHDLTSLLSIYSSLKLVPASYGGYGLILKQLMWAVVGLVAIIVIMYFGNDALYDFIKIVYWILLVMLVVLFLDMMFWKITGRHFPGGLLKISTVLYPVSDTGYWNLSAIWILWKLYWLWKLRSS